jgi:hypothetical protein
MHASVCKWHCQWHFTTQVTTPKRQQRQQMLSCKKVMLALPSFAGIGRRSFVYATLTPQIRAVRSDRSAPAPHAAQTQNKRCSADLCAALCSVAQIPHVACFHLLKLESAADKYSTK